MDSNYDCNIGVDPDFFGFTALIGGTLSFFLSNVSKYESTITAISITTIQFLNENGFNIPEDQITKLIQPEKIQVFTSHGVKLLINLLGNSFLITLIILFILMEFGSFIIKAKAITNKSYQSILYFSTILKNIRHYLAIKTMICLATGICIYISLLIIGVDYPLLWALLAGLMNYIPNVGSVIAIIPIFFFALIQLGIGGALWTFGSFLVIHNVLGNFIEPKLMGKGLDLSALVVILSLIFWGFILGPVGMFLATPFTLTIKIIMEQNEKTRWIAILLGTPAEAKNYLQNKEQVNEQKQNEESLLEKLTGQD
ncbi:MAG: AI-2E family transporter [Draconibacterium sp.]|nr:AI-2E family transporter [Draconibacterium sp.]